MLYWKILPTLPASEASCSRATTRGGRAAERGEEAPPRRRSAVNAGGESGGRGELYGRVYRAECAVVAMVMVWGAALTAGNWRTIGGAGGRGEQRWKKNSVTVRDDRPQLSRSRVVQVTFSGQVQL